MKKVLIVGTIGHTLSLQMAEAVALANVEDLIVIIHTPDIISKEGLMDIKTVPSPQKFGKSYIQQLLYTPNYKDLEVLEEETTSKKLKPKEQPKAGGSKFIPLKGRKW